MSVETEADRLLKLTIEELTSAIRNLSKIYIDKVWGYSDFCSEYKYIIASSFQDLCIIRDKLKCED